MQSRRVGQWGRGSLWVLSESRGMRTRVYVQILLTKKQALQVEALAKISETHGEALDQASVFLEGCLVASTRLCQKLM